MLDFLLYSVPWWAWAVLGLTAALVVTHVFGLKPGIWVLSFVVALILLVRARQSGWKDRVEQEKEAKANSIVGRKESDSEIDSMGESGRDVEWDRWVRDKPGR